MSSSKEMKQSDDDPPSKRWKKINFVIFIINSGFISEPVHQCHLLLVRTRKKSRLWSKTKKKMNNPRRRGKKRKIKKIFFSLKWHFEVYFLGSSIYLTIRSKALPYIWVFLGSLKFRSGTDFHLFINFLY